jgi:hypothetical protein
MAVAARGVARLNVSAFIAHFFTPVKITEYHFARGYKSLLRDENQLYLSPA